METPRKPLNKYWCSVPHYLRDKYFFKIKFVFFLYLRLSASSKENDLPLCIYFWYQTDSGVLNTSIYSAVSHISIGVFVVYIDTGNSMPISPSKSRDLADENNKILTEWKWFETIIKRLNNIEVYFKNALFSAVKSQFSTAPIPLPPLF
jgi:hypothetical protein